MWSKLSLLVLCLFLSGAGHAHPFHTSLTEIEYNTDDHVLEVAVKLTPVDLEEALSAYSGRTIVIDGTDEGDAVIHEYLQYRLRFYSARPAPQGVARPLPLQWVGRQLGVNAVWVFLTVPVSELRLRMDNRLLTEIYPQQVNTISILRNGKKQTHQLTTNNASLALVF